ncbi:hypothetical protein ZOSMA_21G01040 [Zostera marina]|uniref:Uncharacterized protein n=1 Tax=Zostera marina TaxID=29655 RepID=A0A0K9PLZ5_ZOSMR|nr:hypothetical protein ZOSMA_21G01040 [Zostera marina]
MFGLTVHGCGCIYIWIVSWLFSGFVETDSQSEFSSYGKTVGSEEVSGNISSPIKWFYYVCVGCVSEVEKGKMFFLNITFQVIIILLSCKFS